MKSAEEYFNKNYGKGHIEKCIELNDIQSIYSLMEEFKDSEVNENDVSHRFCNCEGHKYSETEKCTECNKQLPPY